MHKVHNLHKNAIQRRVPKKPHKPGSHAQGARTIRKGNVEK